VFGTLRTFYITRYSARHCWVACGLVLRGPRSDNTRWTSPIPTLEGMGLCASVGLMLCTMGWGKQEGEEAVEQATLSLVSPRTLRPRMHGRGLSSREISVEFCCLRSHFHSVLFESHRLVGCLSHQADIRLGKTHSSHSWAWRGWSEGIACPQ
jgi:hypothetical protein